MNKRGQVLVFFIVLIPLILMIFALCIDTALMFSAKIKGKDLLDKAVSENYDIKEYFLLNEIDLTNVKYNSKNNKECVIINYDIDSVFGSIVGFKKYDIEINSCE